MACSDIPFEHYISEVRVARINGEYVVNPTFQQMESIVGHTLEAVSSRLCKGTESSFGPGLG